MRRLLLVVFLALASPLVAGDVDITLFHFSDYHSHARPFFSEGRESQGGIARAIGYLEQERKKPRTFIFSGGDMINKGAPAWSDKYGCVEWPWFDGVLDAMAYGNHDSDYGAVAFQRCRFPLKYPILSANSVDASGNRLFDVEGKPYLVVSRDGVKVGVFAVAGSDFDRLVKIDVRPAPGSSFSDRVAVARDVVAALRDREKVDLVVMIGHEHREEDEQLAHDVPGIDVILGTHSHIKEELRHIEGTSTWTISPYQYLTYISRVVVHLHDGRVEKVTGNLVRVDASMHEKRSVAREVSRLQRELEHDPKYSDLFKVIGRAKRPLLLNDQLHSQTSLGTYILDVVRSAAQADVAFSTTSSFRQPIAPGRITMEDLRGTLPYPNKILVFDVTGEDLKRLLEIVESKKGTDAYAQMAGVPAVIDPKKTYKVATADYFARVSAAYKEFFATRIAADPGLEVRDEVRKAIALHSPIP